MASNEKYAKTDQALSRPTPARYRSTQQDGTEAPFSGEYVDNKATGIYVDLISGEPLFAFGDLLPIFRSTGRRRTYDDNQA
jgi:peptide-methionine (R)-S-oxide reductase